MQVSDLQVIKDIPGFKVILKAILKSQIQQMVEQLAEYTGEESVLLTASVSDGGLSHLGSESGKVFLEIHDDIKSQFLGFCLKRHHQQKQLDMTNIHDWLDSGGEVRQKFGPGSKQRGPRPHVITAAQTQPVALVKSSSKSVSRTTKSMRHGPYTVGLPRYPLPQSLSNQRLDPVINQTLGNIPLDNSTLVEKGLDDSITRNMQEALKVKLEALDNETESDNHSETFDDSQASGHSPQGQYSVPDNVEHSESYKRAASESQTPATISVDSQDFRESGRELAPSNDTEAELSNASRNSSDTDTGYYTPAVDHRKIKVEAITESEMEREDRGVGSGNMPSSNENWMSNIQDMIGSIPAAPGVTNRGEITQDSPHHRNNSHGASDNSGLKTEKVTDTKDIHKTGLKFCNFCDFKTFWFSSLLRHKKSHTNRRVPCPTCPDKSYQTNSDLQEHMKHVHGDGLICDHCSKRFKSRRGLVLHKQQVSGDYRFQCDICLQKFVSRTHYKGHMNSHTGQRDHQCMTCGKLFGQKSSLNRHLEHCPKVKVDRSKDEHKCLECNKVYSSRDTLASHIQGLHSNIVYRCKFCNKLYRWAASYHRHMKLHK